MLQSSRQRKKDTPQSLLKLSEVSPFCHRVDGNGFLERMFFITDIIARFFHGAKPLSAVLCCPSSAYAPECQYFPQNSASVPFKCFRGTFTPYSKEKRSTVLKLPFSMNLEIFYPILKSESILSSHSSERCSLSYSFALKALSSALSDSSTNFTAVLMMVWHA